MVTAGIKSGLARSKLTILFFIFRRRMLRPFSIPLFYYAGVSITSTSYSQVLLVGCNRCFATKYEVADDRSYSNSYQGDGYGNDTPNEHLVSCVYLFFATAARKIVKSRQKDKDNGYYKSDGKEPV